MSDYISYDTPLFTNVWNNATDFVNEYKASGLYDNDNKITDSKATLLFYLLYAKYGNTPIANLDVNQFKYKVFATMMTHGPAWERKLKLQSDLRALTTAELTYSSMSVSNHAANPDTTPTSETLEPLPFVSDQNTSQVIKSKLSAYAGLWEALKNDVTADFLNQFKRFFKIIVYPERPILFRTDADED